ncbi:MAG: polyphosphate kinase 2 family protein [Planctomycetota bacterium]|nr:polyphosphate kinase 2 family protein [Planctomycetota bacterium]
MFDAVPSPYLVPFDGTFRITDAPTAPPEKADDKKELKARLKDLSAEMRELQRRLYAEDEWALLLVFQAMDAAGKDGTIRHVLTGINPAGCQVSSFKKPSSEELEHDFLWRQTKRLPERGRIGVFNRSYYEEVLVVRVHPEILGYQRLPFVNKDNVWTERYASIAHFEKHMARNGTAILKFFLNVSHEEQRRRFLSRIDEAEKNWKFSDADVKERGYWDDYMEAYEDALNATSRPHAPWYAIPADDKHFMRTTVAEIVADALKQIDPKYPVVSAERVAELEAMRASLEKPGA